MPLSRLLVIDGVVDLHVLDVFQQGGTPDRVREVVLFEKAGDGQGRGGSESAVLDIDRDGDPRVVLRGEGEERRMVAAAGVFGRTGLSADVPAFEAGHRGGPADVHAAPHALDDGLEVPGVDLRVVAFVEAAVERILPFDPLDDVRDVVVSSVCDDAGEVGELEGGAPEGILPDREREHREGIPRAAVLAVVVGAVWDVSVSLVEEVGAEFAAESEALDILFPDVETLLDVFVFRVVEDVAEDVAEVGVAGGCHGKAQIEGRGVGVAGHFEPSGLIAVVADVEVRGAQDALLQSDESLHELEGRSGRVLGLDGTVEERFALVVEHPHVVVSALATDEFVGVVRGRGDHHEDLARGGFDGDGGTDLSAHELLAEELQPGVDRADQIAPGFGHGVVKAVHVGALDGAVGVDLLDLDALCAAEFGFVGRFDAAHADVVADLVFGMSFQVGVVDLADVAQQVAADLAGILPHGAVDGVETAEIALVEAEFVLFGDVAGDQTRSAGPDPGVGQFAVEFRAGDSGNLAEACGVESAFVDFAVDDHQVVALAALDEVFAVSVEDLAARRVLHDVPQDVGFGQFGVSFVEELDVGEPGHDHRENEDHDDLQGSHSAEAFGVAHIRPGSFAVKMRAMIQMKAVETTVETAMRSTVWKMCPQERASSRKKTVWWRIVSRRRYSTNFRCPSRSGEGMPPSRTFSRPQAIPAR